MARASKLDPVSTKQQRIAELAKQSPSMGFTSLAYHIDLDWLKEAYRRTRHDAAAGVDGQTAEEYAENLEDNLQSLLNRAKSGTYWAPPVQRVHIPKGTGRETRPIGIPTFEDKILQRAVMMVLEPLYEQDFQDCSYGSRPRRSAHQALADLRGQLMPHGGWVLEVDIQQFFDSLDRAHLREFLNLRVRDGVLQRLIGKWLNAGVLEDGAVTTPETGTPQGGVISPLLANIYLHYVLDVWFNKEVKPCLRGTAALIRYVDDFVMVFTCEEDARRVFEVLPQRFEKYGLTLHPEKTRLVPYVRPSDQPGGPAPGRKPRSSFDFLGFTHYWGRSRWGNWVVKRKTASDRFSRAVRKIAQWCRTHRHLPVKVQHVKLCQKLRGHDQYFGITANFRSLQGLRHVVNRVWRKWLSRRKRGKPIPWSIFNRLLERYPLPKARVHHAV